jgi:HD superfamily phosphohydrolase
VRVSELSKKGDLDLPPELEFIKRMQEGETIERTKVSPEDILPIDDHYIYSLLSKWSRDGPDRILSDFSNRIINRKLLKTSDDLPNSYNSLLEISKKIKAMISQNTGFDPEYYCIMDEPEDIPYDPIRSPSNEEEQQASLRQNIFVKRKDISGFKEISEVSDVIDALTKKRQLRRLYFPEEVRNEVRLVLKKS